LLLPQGAIQTRVKAWREAGYPGVSSITKRLLDYWREAWKAWNAAGPPTPPVMITACNRTETAARVKHAFDSRRIHSRGQMRTWYTGKRCERTRKSHVNVCVYDSSWEASDAFVLDHSDDVAAWVKNDHLGFEVLYVYRDVARKYRPDFLVRLSNGVMLVLETKGQDTEQGRVKRRYLDNHASIQAVALARPRRRRPCAAGP
jgi:hypothetical protein